MWDRLADVGALYPGVGWELPLSALVCVVWFRWVLWQARHESAEYEEQLKALRELGGEASRE